MQTYDQFAENQKGEVIYVSPSDWNEHNRLKMRMCNRCLRIHPITQFEHLREQASGMHALRRRICYRCRRRGDYRKQTMEQVRGVLKQSARKSGLDEAIGLLQLFASTLLGGWSEFADKVGEVARKGSVKQRLDIFRCMMNLFYLYELAKQKEETADSAEQIITRLHKNGQLLPVLRKMNASGVLPLDMIDPAPFSVSDTA